MAVKIVRLNNRHVPVISHQSIKLRKQETRLSNNFTNLQSLILIATNITLTTITPGTGTAMAAMCVRALLQRTLKNYAL